MKTSQFEELKSLDLQKCESVADIVAGLRYCAFGARMLGEVAHTMRDMVSAKEKPMLIYDGLAEVPLGRLLKKLVENQWFKKIITPADFAKSKSHADNFVVVG